jgi:hypothetical protein
MAIEIFKLFGSIFVNNDEANKSIAKTDQKASSVATTLGNGVKKAAKWGAAIVGSAGAAATGLIAMASKTAASADEVDKMSQKLGMSRTAYQEWDYVLSQAGVDINSMQSGLKTLTNKIDEAKNGSSSAQEMFNKLGISMDDINSMSREDVFNTVVSSMQGMEDTAERAALANDLLGKSGQNLTPLFNSTAESTENLKNKAHELGMVMSDETVNSGVKFTDTIDTIKRSAGGLLNSLGGALLPIIQKVCDSFLEYMPQIQQMIGQISPILIQLLDTIMPILADLGATIFPIIMDLLMQIAPVIGDLLKAVAPIIIQIAQQLLPPLLGIINQILPKIISIIDSILPLLSTIFDLLSPFIDIILQLVGVLLNELLTALTPIIEYLTNFLNDLLQPLIPIFEEVGKILGETLSPIFALFGQVLSELFEAFKPILEALGTLISSLFPVITPLVQVLANVFSEKLKSAITAVSNVLKNIMGVFQGIIDFITGVFTGDWEKAWNGVVGIFKNIFNMIPTAVEYIINGAINIINGLISGINWATSAIGWKIDTIPKVTLPRFRAGIDYVPNDKFPAYLDAGEAVLTAREAEEYRQAKRQSGGYSPFSTQKTEPKTINQTFNMNFNVERLEDKTDIDKLVETISEKLAAEIKRKASAYA